MSELPSLPPEFEQPEEPVWWTDLYGPTRQGDPLDPWWVDKTP